jgi:hypothetical protein
MTPPASAVKLAGFHHVRKDKLASCVVKSGLARPAYATNLI